MFAYTPLEAASREDHEQMNARQSQRTQMADRFVFQIVGPSSGQFCACGQIQISCTGRMSVDISAQDFIKISKQSDNLYMHIYIYNFVGRTS